MSAGSVSIGSRLPKYRRKFHKFCCTQLHLCVIIRNMSKTIATLLLSLALSAFTCGQTAEKPLTPPAGTQDEQKPRTKSPIITQAEIDAMFNAIRKYDALECNYEPMGVICSQKRTVLL